MAIAASPLGRRAAADVDARQKRMDNEWHFSSVDSPGPQGMGRGTASRNLVLLSSPEPGRRSLPATARGADRETSGLELKSISLAASLGRHWNSDVVSWNLQGPSSSAGDTPPDRAVEMLWDSADKAAKELSHSGGGAVQRRLSSHPSDPSGLVEGWS